MYADQMTESMKIAISETKRRREIQEKYNKEHGIKPKTIQKAVHDVVRATVAAEEEQQYQVSEKYGKMSKKEKRKTHCQFRERNERSSQSA